MPPATFDEQVVAKVWNPAAANDALVNSFIHEAESLMDWDHDHLYSFIQEFIQRNNVKMGQLMNPLRLLLIGSNQGPGIIDMAEILGKELFLARIENGLTKLQV